MAFSVRAFSVFAASGVVAVGGAMAHPGGVHGHEDVHYCFPGEHGSLELRGGIERFRVDPAVAGHLNAKAAARGARGTIGERLDVVFVGDGYTAAEQGLFHADAQSVEASLFAYEPFKAYRNYFAIHRVEVISNESGVDNDPFGVLRDTALGMRYWCNNIERLLCVDVGAAYAAASLAPDIDQVIALANSSKYGGAGYTTSNLGTAAGGNSLAADIVIHELGHSLGDLADEYTYGGPTTYNGSEPGDANVSIYDASQMISLDTKWADWIGSNDPRFDGPVDTFEGGMYSVFGIYRPTNNSMMRALGRPFNAPSAEALIIEVYREVSTIDGFTSNAQLIPADQAVSVAPMQPIGHSLDIEWSVDGAVVPGETGPTLDLSTLNITEQVVVTATVTDNTDMVRDEDARAAFMTDSVSWGVVPSGDPCPGDTDGDGLVGLGDLLTVLGAFASSTAGGAGSGDIDGSGVVGLEDLLEVLGAFGGSC